MFGRDIVSYRKSRYTTKCHNIFSMSLFLVVGLDIVFYNFIYTYGGLTIFITIEMLIGCSKYVWVGLSLKWFG